jgi:hypothetical protein
VAHLLRLRLDFQIGLDPRGIRFSLDHRGARLVGFDVFHAVHQGGHIVGLQVLLDMLAGSAACSSRQQSRLR